MDPKTGVSSRRVQKRDCDESVGRSPPHSRPKPANPKVNCQMFCKEPHPTQPGISLRDVLSITIRASIQCDSTVKIYGAIRVFNSFGAELGDYVFLRQKKDALELSPGQNLTLPLQDPVDLNFFDDNIAEFALIFLLMCNDGTIFNETRKRYRRKVMECSSLFADEEDISRVGCGLYYLPGYIRCFERYPKLLHLPLESETLDSKICSDKVDSVDVKMVVMGSGYLAILTFKAPCGGRFHGKITARLCLFEEGDNMLLFEKNEKEAVLVDSDGEIPLSRSMVAVGCGSSLVIQVQLHDGCHPNTTGVHGTIHFHIGDTSPNTVLQGFSHLIQVDISWRKFLQGGKIGATRTF